MKPGFTLIEIILATALAAIISVALIVMLQQMNGTLMRVDRISDLDMRATMLQNQMERDLAGAFAPTDFSATNSSGESSFAKASDFAKASTDTSADKAKGPKKIEKIFWGDKTLEMLTFITNNPLQAYWGERFRQSSTKNCACCVSLNS